MYNLGSLWCDNLMLRHVHIYTKHDAGECSNERHESNACANEGGLIQSFARMSDHEDAGDGANDTKDRKQSQAIPAHLLAEAMFVHDVTADDGRRHPVNKFDDVEHFAGLHFVELTGEYDERFLIQRLRGRS